MAFWTKLVLLNNILRGPSGHYQTVGVGESGCCASCSCATRSNPSPGFLLSQDVGTFHAPLPPRSPGSSRAREGSGNRRHVSDGRLGQQACHIASSITWLYWCCADSHARESVHISVAPLSSLPPCEDVVVPFFFCFLVFHKTAVLCYCLSSLSHPDCRRGSPRVSNSN